MEAVFAAVPASGPIACGVWFWRYLPKIRVEARVLVAQGIAGGEPAAGDDLAPIQ